MTTRPARLTIAVLASLTVLLAPALSHRLHQVHAASLPHSLPPGPPTRTPILVELFTSEGCSSCPPADALLATLDRQQPIATADIIALGQHVDYWDSFGWKDRFSSADATTRQRQCGEYFHLDDIFTPQAVVNGSAQFNGTDRAAIEQAIATASSASTPSLHFASVRMQSDAVTFTLKPGTPVTSGPVNLYAALVAPAAITSVGAGENTGHTLHHAGVVRVLAKLTTSSTPAIDERPFTIQRRSRGRLSGLHLVVFHQTRPIGPFITTVACWLAAPTAPAYPLCPSEPPA